MICFAIWLDITILIYIMYIDVHISMYKHYKLFIYIYIYLDHYSIYINNVVSFFIYFTETRFRIVHPQDLGR